jgi:hypothetical protein
MVEVFKTDVQEHKATMLLTALYHAFPKCRINFDLDDRDRILRVEGSEICTESVINLLGTYSCYCEVLEY